MPTWPASLPQKPTAAGFTETVPTNTVRSAMDAGLPKARRRFTSGVRGLSMQFILEPSQVDTLDAFYVTTTLSGSLSFDWSHPRTDAAGTFRFTQAPTYTPVDEGAWQAAVSMELLP